MGMEFEQWRRIPTRTGFSYSGLAQDSSTGSACYALSLASGPLGPFLTGYRDKCFHMQEVL